MARLTTEQRNALPSSAFAGPDRSYPINDPSHARNALARASQFASPGLQEKVEAKVHKKYPAIGKKAMGPKMRSAMKAGRVSKSAAEKRGYDTDME
jgi:hypothetical protein